LEKVLDICEKEQPDGVIYSTGGQIAQNMAEKLVDFGINLLGTSVKSVDFCEDRGKFSALCDELEIDQPEWAKFANLKDAFIFAEKVGYPVVMKIHSPEITHKSEVGGVALGLENEEMVRATFKGMMEHVKKLLPDIEIEGVTIQRMVDTRDTVELIIGIKKDPVFGTVMLVGMGGITAELFEDRRLEFPPLNEQLAHQMLKSLRIYPLLTGYRGSKPKNIDKLIEVLIRISYLAADYPEIEELDINPIIVGPEDVVALDARIVVDEEIPALNVILIVSLGISTSLDATVTRRRSAISAGMAKYTLGISNNAVSLN
jgi:hypothetical protein